MKLSRYWTEEKQIKLSDLYPYRERKEIENIFPEYTWRSIQNIANYLKIKRLSCTTRNGSIEVLFNKTFNSFYWLGFILADGCINEDGTLKVDLAIKDAEHVIKLSTYLNTKYYFYPKYKSGKEGGTGICRVKIKDAILGVKLRDYLGVTGIKTYVPFSLDFIRNKYQMMAFLAGFIDGDGTIYENGSASIVGHSNYFNFFENLGEILLNYKIISNFTVKISKNTSVIHFHRKNDMQSLKEQLIRMKLPLLLRKWNRTSYKKEINILLNNKSAIKTMRKRKISNTNICKALNYKHMGNLTTFCKKWKI